RQLLILIFSIPADMIFHIILLKQHILIKMRKNFVIQMI
ncbi:putative hemoglobin and hemoglobin-haptoglobin-binding protein 2 precursor, partial [Haemophilus influenzae]